MPSLFGYNRLATDVNFRRQFLGEAIGENATLKGHSVTRVGPYRTLEPEENSSVTGLLFRDVSDESLRKLDRQAAADGMTRHQFDVISGDATISYAEAYVLGNHSLRIRRGVTKPVIRYAREAVAA